MGLDYSIIANGTNSGGGDGPLFSVSLMDIIGIAVGDPGSALNYFNQTVYQAENNLPEGTRVMASLSGWTLPVIGSVGQRFANYLNQQWQSGSIQDPEHPGETLSAWPDPGYSNTIATYDASTDVLQLRWIKGQPWFLWLLVVLFAAYAALELIQWLDPSLLHGYTVRKAVEQVTSAVTSPVKTVILVVSGLALLGGGLWYVAQINIAKASASKSYQEINYGR